MFRGFKGPNTCRESQKHTHFTPWSRQKVLKLLGLTPGKSKLACFPTTRTTQGSYVVGENQCFSVCLVKFGLFAVGKPPRTQLLKVIGKCCLNPCELVLKHPKWEEQSWYQLLKKVSVKKVDFFHKNRFFQKGRSTNGFSRTSGVLSVYPCFARHPRTFQSSFYPGTGPPSFSTRPRESHLSPQNLGEIIVDTLDELDLRFFDEYSDDESRPVTDLPLFLFSEQSPNISLSVILTSSFFLVK